MTVKRQIIVKPKRPRDRKMAKKLEKYLNWKIDLAEFMKKSLGEILRKVTTERKVL